jgi:hypothetical protein
MPLPTVSRLSFSRHDQRSSNSAVIGQSCFSPIYRISSPLPHATISELSPDNLPYSGDRVARCSCIQFAVPCKSASIVPLMISMQYRASGFILPPTQRTAEVVASEVRSCLFLPMFSPASNSLVSPSIEKGCYDRPILLTQPREDHGRKGSFNRRIPRCQRLEQGNRKKASWTDVAHTILPARMILYPGSLCSPQLS